MSSGAAQVLCIQSSRRNLVIRSLYVLNVSQSGLAVNETPYHGIVALETRDPFKVMIDARYDYPK